MTQRPGNKSLAVATWVLRVVLGLAFLAIGAAKLTGSAHTVDLFAAIGWGQWFRYMTGALDVLGALMLFWPRWTRYGALLLACTVGSATAFSIELHNNPAVPLVLTLLVLTLALLSRSHRDRSNAAHE